MFLNTYDVSITLVLIVDVCDLNRIKYCGDHSIDCEPIVDNNLVHVPECHCIEPYEGDRCQHRGGKNPENSKTLIRM